MSDPNSNFYIMGRFRILNKGCKLRDYHTSRIHRSLSSVFPGKIDNRFFERVEELKYLGTILKNQNSIQEEIKS